MYETYWNLAEKPFRNTINSKFLFYSPTHEEAFVRLLYAVSEGKGLMLLTGEGGCGKTFLCKTLMKDLFERGLKVAYLGNADLEPLEFLQEVLCEFGLEFKGKSKIELLRDLQDFLQQNAEKGSYCVLIVDEAQLIQNRKTLEEIRLLLNFERDDRFLLTIVMAGQPEFGQMVRKIPSLRERIGVQYRIFPLTREEAGEYIVSRMNKAGAGREIFTSDAVREIFAVAGGIPREINTICDMALLIGCGEEAVVIDRAIVQKAIHDCRGVEPERKKTFRAH